ncbi:MAG: glycyl-radical enzyme activating protein [Ruminococcaceae bacterium]|nr:glycyl-radical enzyme activating protein [Oscillospiraceae bacterium]
MTKGIIFDIKEFSLNDGEGIRTTVFFKGCPLRCIWCHNPEGLSPGRELFVTKNGCSECGLCKKPCDHEDCRGLGRCIHICPKGLVKAAGREVDAAELAAEIKRGEDLFLSTGGGVTLSGGEVLMQPDFALELTEALKPLNILIETCGHAKREDFIRVVEKVDTVYFDVKLADREAHKKYTGVYNDLILENLEWLKKSGKKFKIRTPLIPGITDTEENLSAIAKIADGAPVELLPYNKLAGAKYEGVGKKFTDAIKSDTSRIKSTDGLPENFKLK